MDENIKLILPWSVRSMRKGMFKFFGHDTSTQAAVRFHKSLFLLFGRLSRVFNQTSSSGEPASNPVRV